jgi:outer membrane lipopolysaccharide assembly protein LptE/RlpB
MIIKNFLFILLMVALFGAFGCCTYKLLEKIRIENALNQIDWHIRSMYLPKLTI